MTSQEPETKELKPRSEPKLKACPFCAWLSVGFYRGRYWGAWYVACDNCGAMSGQFNKREAATRWNRRPK